MSAADDNGVLPNLLLRTSTPAPNEKVLLYLEKMTHERPGDTPSEFGLDDEDLAGSIRSTTPSAIGATRAAPMRGNTVEDLGASQLSWNGMGAGQTRDVDVDSNVQEESTSEVAHREPGPEDEPHGFYPSLGSSWGNFGPLPNSRHESYQHPVHPQNAAAIPLPKSIMSPRSAAMNIAEPATGSRAPSKAPSRTSGRSRSAKPEDADRVTMSDRSEHVPKTPSIAAKSTTSQRSKAKALEVPDSGLDNRSTVSRVTQKTGARSHVSRAPSLSPSDSPSNFGMKQRPPVQPKQSSQFSEHPRPRDPSPVRSGPARSVPQQLHSPQPSRAFSPHRHAATGEDLFQAALRSAAASPGRSQVRGLPPPAEEVPESEGQVTPRVQSPDLMTVAEEKVIVELLARTPNRTSYAPSTLEVDYQNSNYHDMELCILLHGLDDPNQHEVAKKALRKAVRQRVKRLGLKYDHESIKQYRKSFHDHDPSFHDTQHDRTGQTDLSRIPEEPPQWAKDMIHTLQNLTTRVDGLGPKIDSIKSSQDGSHLHEDSMHGYTPSEQERLQSPMSRSLPIRRQATDTMGGSVYNAPETVLESVMPGPTIGSMHQHDESVHVNQEDFIDDETQLRGTSVRDEDVHQASDYPLDGRHQSPGQQYLEEELYRLQEGQSQAGTTVKTWTIRRDEDDYVDDEHHVAVTESGMPEIQGSQPGYTETGRTSPPLPPLPAEHGQQDGGYGDYADDQQAPPPWQKIHQRLLQWAIVWPMTEFDAALNSTTRGNQIDEIALSIWSTQTYKRYVRSKMTDSPQGRVDRLFVPPNMADAISNAVYNGRHGDACAMLRDLWSPFGLEGMPRLLIVLAKHRTDENHWVVHRFSLPEGTLTTYDTYPERCLPDGRPLGWWFAIRIAWPNAIYPSPDHLMQKMVRLHRPMQLGIDNSVAAAGIWRNLLMGSRAERSVDLERLRDLINTEVKNLRQRKHLGKLSISPNVRPTWYD